MKRLNEYTLAELRLLQMALALAYQTVTRDNPNESVNGILSWSADVRQAIEDQELEANSLPFNRS